MKGTTLVCDVDNTILSTRPRVRRCLEAIGRGEVYERAADSYSGFRDHLTPAEVERFFELFLSERYLEVDEPLPGAGPTLNAWVAGGHRLVYLTGRHDVPGDSMRAGTQRWLRDHGYPVPEGEQVELVMKPQRYQNDMAHKRAALERLRARHRLGIGLGDLPQEGPLYAAFGMKPILISQVGLFPEDELKESHPEAVVARDWDEVARWLQRWDGS